MQTKGINVQDQGARNCAQKVQGKGTRLDIGLKSARSQSCKSKVQDIWLLQTCNTKIQDIGFNKRARQLCIAYKTYRREGT